MWAAQASIQGRVGTTARTQQGTEGVCPGRVPSMSNSTPPHSRTTKDSSKCTRKQQPLAKGGRGFEQTANKDMKRLRIGSHQGSASQVHHGVRLTPQSRATRKAPQTTELQGVEGGRNGRATSGKRRSSAWKTTSAPQK